MSERDYTGVATRELMAVFDSSFSPPPAFETWARDHGFNPDMLRRTVVKPQYPWVCLDTADKICTALGLNLSALVLDGSLTIIPARGKTAALKMVKDEISFGSPLSKNEIDQRVAAMMSLREECCGPLTEYQLEIVRQDEKRVARRKMRQAAAT